MRTSILVLCTLATPGLFVGGVGAFFIDSDEFPLSKLAGWIAWASIPVILAGAVLLLHRNRSWRWVSFWCIISAAALSWLAFAIGIAVCREAIRIHPWAGSIIMIWFMIFWLPGVLPATIAASRAIAGRIWNADNQPAVR